MAKEYDFLTLFDQFIQASKTGRRRKNDGGRITAGTIEGYENTRKLITEFCNKRKFHLRIIPINRLPKREFRREKNYWKRFYRQFTDFLYRDKGVYDNYVGYCIKPLRTFFRYLNNEMNISIGEMYRTFYVTSEETKIIVLQPAQLNFLIQDETLNKLLTKRQREVKDIFIFGCAVALRFSDIMKLKPADILVFNGETYLGTISQKTKTTTRIKLPDFALNIALKYKKRRKFLFPQYPLATFNAILKKIGEKAGWTGTVEKERQAKDSSKIIYKAKASREHYRFCDLMSSHMMRRTAITNMLMLGVDETVARKISGHAPGSKEFFRYVEYAQSFTDNQTDGYFDRLKEIRG